MGFGRTIPDGRLPVFSVETVAEAKALITLCCPRGLDGKFFARELADEQTLENLQRFSDRLAAAYPLIRRAKC